MWTQLASILIPFSQDRQICLVTCKVIHRNCLFIYMVTCVQELVVGMKSFLNKKRAKRKAISVGHLCIRRNLFYGKWANMALGAYWYCIRQIERGLCFAVISIPRLDITNWDKQGMLFPHHNSLGRHCFSWLCKFWEGLEEWDGSRNFQIVIVIAQISLEILSFVLEESSSLIS